MGKLALKLEAWILFGSVLLEFENETSSSREGQDKEDLDETPQAEPQLA
jgi:hypothetical protein